MPRRKIPIVTNYFYHIFNRGVAKLPTFTQPCEYGRALALINYYRFDNVPLKYSVFVQLSNQHQKEILLFLKKEKQIRIRILSFTLMTNHFHFLLQQTISDGIKKFMADFTNSYTKYVNTKERRPGPLFQGRFKSVLVQTEAQLLHLSRYHHLNPLMGNIVNSFEELVEYPYSSLPNYMGNLLYDFIDSELILSHFKSKYAYGKFVKNQSNYQRKLAKIKKNSSRVTLPRRVWISTKFVKNRFLRSVSKHSTSLLEGVII